MGDGNGEAATGPRVLDLRARLARLRESSEAWRKVVPVARLLPEEMSPDELRAVEHHMRPGRDSNAGFLLPDQSLPALVERDDEILAELGVTHERLANRLEYLLRFVHVMPGPPVVALGRFQVEGTVFLGYQWCPFARARGKHCGRTDREASITNLVSGEALEVTGLHPHLIREHHFFEGGPYRVDPRQAIRVLELSPHVDDLIRPSVSGELTWGLGSRCRWDGFLWRCPEIQRLLSAATELQPFPGLSAFIDGDIGFVCAPAEVRIEKPIDIEGASLTLGTFSGGAEIFRHLGRVEALDVARIAELERIHALSSLAPATGDRPGEE